MSLKGHFFAWCNEGDVFDEATHAVSNPDVAQIVIEQSSSEWCAARVTFIGAEDGFEMPAEQWCHIAVRTADNQVKHLFHGEVNDYPLEIRVGRRFVLEFLAKAPDAEEQEKALLEQENRQAPYWNDLTVPVTERDKAPPLLEGRACQVDWDRRTLAPRLSDILEGRQRITVEGSQHDVQGFTSKQVGLPLKRINFTISVQYHQYGFAIAQIGSVIRNLFGNAPDGEKAISTLTGPAFAAGFNALKLPDGYANGDRTLQQLKVGERGLLAEHFESSRANVNVANYPTGDTEYDTANPGAARQAFTTRNWYDVDYTLHAEYRQKRRELLTGTVLVGLAGAGLAAGVENITIGLLIPTEAENGSVLSSSAESFFIGPDGELTADGRLALDHALARIAARAKFAGRSIESTFRCAVDHMLDISCDHSIDLRAPQLHGGRLEGKVLSYRLVIGDGEENAYVVIGSSRGNGEDAPAADHIVDPVVYRNAQGADATCTSAMAYSDPALPAPLVPVDVAAMLADPDNYLVGAATVSNPGEEQDAGFAAAANPDQYLIAHPTTFEIEMRSLDPVDELLLEIPGFNVTLTLPRHTGL